MFTSVDTWWSKIPLYSAISPQSRMSFIRNIVWIYMQIITSIRSIVNIICVLEVWCKMFVLFGVDRVPSFVSRFLLALAFCGVASNPPQVLLTPLLFCAYATLFDKRCVMFEPPTRISFEVVKLERSATKSAKKIVSVPVASTGPSLLLFSWW